MESLFYKEEPADVAVPASVGRTLSLVGFSWTLGNGVGGGYLGVTGSRPWL